MFWIAAAIVSWWLGALAAGVRYDLVRLEAGDEPGEGYDLVSLLRRLRDDPVALGLRLRFSRFFAAAFVPLTLAAAVTDLRWEWTLAAFAVGWFAAAAAEATGGGRVTRRIGRLRGGMLYGAWARLTLPAVRLTGPLLRLRTNAIEDEDERSLVLAESEAALAASRGRLGREERRLLRGLLASGNIRVADIMTPWERVRRLDAERSLAEDVPPGERVRRLDAERSLAEDVPPGERVRRLDAERSPADDVPPGDRVRRLDSERSLAEDVPPGERVRRLDSERSLAEAAAAVHESGHSRLPVLRDGKVVGVLTAKDLLRRDEDAEGGLREILRPPYFVTGELNGRDLLEELQAARVHLAVVVDRLGRLVGIVTMEDLLEEIVGELYDEREREPKR